MAEVREELNKVKNENLKMQLEIDRVDQNSRNNSVGIFGITEEANENIMKKVLKIFNHKMNLNIKEDLIKECYRIGMKKVNEKARSVVVAFYNRAPKECVYVNKKKLKNTGIVIREDITKLRLYLLNRAIEKVGVKNTWTYNGLVYLLSNGRKHKIEMISDLDLIGTDGSAQTADN